MAEGGLMCWNCGRPTGITAKVMRADQCVHCLADLRSCRGCRFFDPTRRFQCKEVVEKPQANKEKANFCDFFMMRDVVKTPGGISSQSDSKDDKKKKFDDLFKD